jgi:hypothetical protein
MSLLLLPFSARTSPAGAQKNAVTPSAQSGIMMPNISGNCQQPESTPATEDHVPPVPPSGLGKDLLSVQSFFRSTDQQDTAQNPLGT